MTQCYLLTTCMCISFESIPRAILFNLMRFTFTSFLWFCRLILFAYRLRWPQWTGMCVAVRTVAAVDTRHTHTHRTDDQSALRQFSGVTCLIFVECEIFIAHTKSHRCNSWKTIRCDDTTTAWLLIAISFWFYWNNRNGTNAEAQKKG